MDLPFNHTRAFTEAEKAICTAFFFSLNLDQLRSRQSLAQRQMELLAGQQSPAYDRQWDIEQSLTHVIDWRTFESYPTTRHATVLEYVDRHGEYAERRGYYLATFPGLAIVRRAVNRWQVLHLASGYVFRWDYATRKDAYGACLAVQEYVDWRLCWEALPLHFNQMLTTDN
jgi:hypothetical protein